MTTINDKLFAKPSCKFKFLAKEGFNIPNFYEITDDLDILGLYKSYITHKRDSLEYDIDGLVEEVNDYSIQQELGFEPNGLNPKYATAIKFDSVAAVTPLTMVDWNTGMTGKVVPRGWFESVDIMGVTIQKATLHNHDFLMNLIKEGMKIGSKVIIVRAGDVIPKIMGVKEVAKDGIEIVIPTNCPVCDTTLNKFSVDLVCENPECGAKTKGIFTNFFETLKIKGVSDKFIEKAIEEYAISTIDDLLSLTLEQIEALPGFAKKSANLAFDAIHSVKEVSPEQFMALLNIPNQGVRVFENLFSQTPIEKLLDEDFKPEDLLDTKGIAEKTAMAIHKGIQDNLEVIRQNAQHFTIITKRKNTDNHNPKVTGKVFCITGKLETGSRESIEEMIKMAGGSIGSVSANLDFLVTNDTDTSSGKMKKATDLNTKWHNNGDDKRILLLTEIQLLNLLKGE